MISQAELESMQGVLTQTRVAVATILRPVRVSDNAGGFVQRWEPVYEDLSARITPQGMQPWERVDRIENRIITTSVWMIALPAGTDVRSSDRIQIEAIIYEVIAARAPRNNELERTVQAVLVI